MGEGAGGAGGGGVQVGQVGVGVQAWQVREKNGVWEAGWKDEWVDA